MTSTLARAVEVSTGEQDLNASLRHLKTAMELKWEQERREREKWKEEDKQDNFYARIVAMLAAAIISEGAVGTRPRSDQVACMAIEYADAIMLKLREKNTPPSP